jgi:hypothetical protein
MTDLGTRYMGALSNSGRKAANLAGFYKGIQSAGAAVFWRLDGIGKPFDTIFGATVRFLCSYPHPSEATLRSSDIS